MWRWFSAKIGSGQSMLIVIQAVAIFLSSFRLALGQESSPVPVSESNSWKNIIEVVKQLEPFLTLVVLIGVVAAVIIFLFVYRRFPDRLVNAVDQGIAKGIGDSFSSTQVRDWPKVAINTLANEIGLKEKLDDFAKRFLAIIEGKPINIHTGAVGTRPSYSTALHAPAGPLAEVLRNAEASINNGNAERARDICNDSLGKPDTHPSDRAQMLIMLARAYTRLSQFVEAEDRLKEVEGICGVEMKAQLYMNWMILSRERGELDMAREMGEKARMIDPENPRILNELSFLIWLTARVKGAEEEKERALEAESLARSALSAAANTGNTALLLSIANNLAYFLALTGGQDRIERALNLTEGFVTAGATRANYVDTRGFVCLTAFKMHISLSRRSEDARYLLDEAIRCFENARKMAQSKPIYCDHLSEGLTLQETYFA